MLQIRTILHPTDFSPCADAAFAHALRLARRHGASVRLVNVLPDLRKHHLHDVLSAFLDEETLYGRQREEAERKIQLLLDSHHDAGSVDLYWEVLSGFRTAATLLDDAEVQDVDLIVMGTHGERGLGRLLLGSVAETLVRRASCPVLTVRVQDGARRVDLPVYRRVLVPVDFSEFARQAVAYARALIEPGDGVIDLLHVIDPVRLPLFYQAGLQQREVVAGELEAEAVDALEELWEVAGGPAQQALFHTCTGYPPAEIVAFAEAQPVDLIVLPTHGLRGLERIPMGSVAERVVRAAPCPVFVTRPFGKSLLRGFAEPVAEAVYPSTTR